MQRLEVSGAVRPIYGSLVVKRLSNVRMDYQPSLMVFGVSDRNSVMNCVKYT